MTSSQLQAVACSTAANARIFLPYISAAFERYGINTPERQLCFMAQVAHESGGLFYTEELATGAAYEGRESLGNTQPGDGVRFKGRGLIQITGRNNYRLVSEALQADFITHPQLLGGKNITLCSPDQLRYAALSAGWFWDRAGLNAFADKINSKQPVDSGANLEFFKRITKGVNGGYNGLPDRLHRYIQGAAALLPVNATQPAVTQT
ncbi:glycoside hydrolase family 19 protein [Dyadobacter flavalbus]|uniref:glycoside hydrolase family 19 protein n=1 Tax=Dyadobacter flavalbus TaxID=2579942 RepID=UPI00191C6B3C|nr:hypothetical protein [Dyadobacter flavalbus]